MHSVNWYRERGRRTKFNTELLQQPTNRTNKHQKEFPWHHDEPDTDLRDLLAPEIGIKKPLPQKIEKSIEHERVDRIDDSMSRRPEASLDLEWDP